MFKRLAHLWHAERGISLIDQLATLAILGTVAAIAVPALSNSVENQRLGMELRNVKREIELARLSAVATNRPIRVRFDCPSTGYYRRVELIGTPNNENAGDDNNGQGVRRCSTTYYPYPAADKDPLTRPNDDGPVMQLNTKVTFTSTQTIEFWPNGTAHVAPSDGITSPWPQIGDTPVNILMTKGSTTRSITVNSLGRVQIQ
ncbi:MAG TPA: GspH/FimT family pseudopilin [Vicinamibacterales bacterium]|nr:GspH/FimT family pseudopilin [Vicinamibacterales bacterium]